MILVLALVTATLQPAQPQVGDLITVTFPAPVVLDASKEYEVVQRGGNRVVLRTFEPRPFALNGTMGSVRFSNLKVPVRSVLKQGDDFTPAPLAPPAPVPYPMLPFAAIGIAALLAVAAWVFAWRRGRKPVEVIAPVLAPADRFRAAVLTLREHPSYEWRWAALANETRAYLNATRPHFSSDLTTTELLRLLRDEERIVEEILRQGDLQKFSKRGAAERDFDELADRALELAS